MALDQSYIGRTYAPSEPYEVGREKIREFADAIGDDNPAYRDPDAAKALGYDDVIAPPTFAIVLSARVATQVIHDPEFGLDYSRVVHGEQRFVHRRPVRAGDRLIGVLTVDNIRAAAGNDIVSTRVELSTEAGEPVATAYSTLVARAPAGTPAPQSTP
ncbi:MAG: MaoC family dehydratase N-terminal domain-containing protein [Geodermatophilaceae bacterium]|nr:MaoC family dehydratase N-terminal domain-containing protein [Geodermatophilaceae bacterium]